jgi:hypothetical protein
MIVGVILIISKRVIKPNIFKKLAMNAARDIKGQL